MRQQVADTLEYCRALAVSLRPPLLDEIGLVPALEQLADRAQAERVSVDRALDAMDLGPELQTELYRSVEEALASVAGRPTLAVSLDSAIPRVRISVRPLDAQPTIAVLGTLEARVELLGGRITASGGELVMHIPIDPGPGPAAVFPQPQPVEIPDGERPARA